MAWLCQGRPGASPRTAPGFCTQGEASREGFRNALLRAAGPPVRHCPARPGKGSRAQVPRKTAGDARQGFAESGGVVGEASPRAGRPLTGPVGGRRFPGTSSPARPSAKRCRGRSAPLRGLARDGRALGDSLSGNAGSEARPRRGRRCLRRSFASGGRAQNSALPRAAGGPVRFCSPFGSRGRRAGDRSRAPAPRGWRGVQRGLAVGLAGGGRGRRGVTPSVGMPHRRPGRARGGGALGKTPAESGRALAKLCRGRPGHSRGPLGLRPGLAIGSQAIGKAWPRAAGSAAVPYRLLPGPGRGLAKGGRALGKLRPGRPSPRQRPAGRPGP